MPSRLLEIAVADKPARVFPMNKPIVRIGRAQDNDIVLHDERAVSRWHAVISHEAEGPVMLFDLESENGTFLNGWPIGQPVPVQPDDTIKIGNFRFVLREERVTPDGPHR
ncbi:MAG: FHA domain-containing protein [Acidobacteriaceae bacterium]|nr:FHA domain-containing protein [Acidobacteriaceae bacterium]